MYGHIVELLDSLSTAWISLSFLPTLLLILMNTYIWAQLMAHVKNVELVTGDVQVIEKGMCVVICHKSLSTFGASFHRFIHLGQLSFVRESLFSYFLIILLSAHSIEPLLPQYSCIQVFQRGHYLSSRTTHPDAPCAPGSLLCANSTNDHRLHHW